ncbi:MAG TPA: FixH family protein [Blastocatellia bacterium]|nr:FixH family protein [Blastocatellia bacterium]
MCSRVAILAIKRDGLFAAFVATVFLAAFPAMTSCRKRSHASRVAVTIEHQIAPQPVRTGPATITLTLKDASRAPVRGAAIQLEADMSHPGMSPLFGKAEEVNPGQYQTQLRFSMAGDWVILIHGILPGGQSVERQFDVKGVRPE